MVGEPCKYSIVVPFYNECDNIRPLYDKLVKVMDSVGSSFEMVFVDDGSNDASFKILHWQAIQAGEMEKAGIAGKFLWENY